MEGKENHERRAETLGERMEGEGMREIEEQGEVVESEDEEDEDEEDREYERQQNEREIGGQDVMEETEGEGMDVEESAGELEGTELNEECGGGEGEMRGDEVRGSTELEEREGWPMWLRNAMDMLHSTSESSLSLVAYSRALFRASDPHIPARDSSSSLTALSSCLLDHSCRSPTSISSVSYIHHLRASINKKIPFPPAFDHVLVPFPLFQLLMPP